MRRGEPWLVGYVARKAGVTEEAVMEAVNARGRPSCPTPPRPPSTPSSRRPGLTPKRQFWTAVSAGYGLCFIAVVLAPLLQRFSL